MELTEYIIFECPHCSEYIQVYRNEFFCKVFRHGVFKSNYQQINPHLSQEECDKYLQEGTIFGCSYQFKFTRQDDKLTVDKCVGL